jgi:hypothetical protein
MMIAKFILTVESILKSNPRLVRMLILLVVVCFGAYYLTVSIFRNINTVSDFSIEVNEKGGIIWKVVAKDNITEKYAQLLLPSNSVWYNTGVKLQPDEECRIEITGNVHLAFSALNSDVDNDMIPKIKWTGPDGNVWANVGDDLECQAAKTNLLIKPGTKIGNVVGYLHTKDLDEIGFISEFLSQRKAMSAEVTEINAIGSLANNKAAETILYLTVNDILLDFSDSIQEKISNIAFEGRNHKKGEWAKLRNEKEYYRLWFDDNIGGFLVNITVRKKNAVKKR